jgi:hypothetical protein
MLECQVFQVSTLMREWVVCADFNVLEVFTVLSGFKV